MLHLMVRESRILRRVVCPDTCRLSAVSSLPVPHIGLLAAVRCIPGPIPSSEKIASLGVIGVSCLTYMVGKIPSTTFRRAFIWRRKPLFPIWMKAWNTNTTFYNGYSCIIVDECVYRRWNSIMYHTGGSVTGCGRDCKQIICHRMPTDPDRALTLDGNTGQFHLSLM